MELIDTQQELAIKNLDAVALEMIRKADLDGKARFEVAGELRDMGYTTKTGKPLTDSCLSEFACENGLRKVNKGPSKKVKDDVKLEYILDQVMSSNLPSTVKIYLVRKLK